MTTTDEALVEQIARAIYEAEIEDDWLYELNEYKEPYLIFAAAVLPIIRKAQADALREAADDMDNTDDQDWHYIADGDADDWLRARAGRIEETTP